MATAATDCDSKVQPQIQTIGAENDSQATEWVEKEICEELAELEQNSKDGNALRVVAGEREVVGGGFEPPTRGFSVHCSTN